MDESSNQTDFPAYLQASEQSPLPPRAIQNLRAVDEVAPAIVPVGPAAGYTRNRWTITTTVGAFGAATFLFMPNISAARAADSVLVRGTIVSLDGSMLTLKTRDGATTAVALKDGWELTGIAKAAPDDIKPGEFVGIASAPTAEGGDATVGVLILPAAFEGAGEASYPWYLKPHSVLTNAAVPYAVVSVDGRTLTVSYRGREAKIAIADDTPVVTFAPAIRADLTAGATVFVPAERGSDGALAAGFVIVGANGAVPPM
jgi:hypothetical protein